MRRRALQSLCRLHSTAPASRTAYYLSLLERNPELSEADARNELRWLRQASSGDFASGEDVLERFVQRRATGEPLQYILGTQAPDFADEPGDTDFGPLTLLTRPPVLIPRPETAYIMEQLILRLPQRPLKVLDLCTGSGCIPLLLAHRRNVTAWGVDINEAAISLANDNKALLAKQKQLNNPVTFLQSDIFAPTFAHEIHSRIGEVDLITANPPYIPRPEYDALPPSVREWEDERALLAGDVGPSAGVAFYARIAELAMELMSHSDKPRISLAVEIGATQGQAVRDLLPGATEIVQDQWGKDRMVIASY